MSITTPATTNAAGDGPFAGAIRTAAMDLTINGRSHTLSVDIRTSLPAV
jgi:hypothetical protein